jgi:hypothetical protein
MIVIKRCTMDEAYFPGDTELRRQIRKFLQADPGNKSRLAREFNVTEAVIESWEWGESSPDRRTTGTVFEFLERSSRSERG